jgi:hypothetical protein
MRHLSIQVGVIVLACLLLSAGLSAQRYTGHDHAVFHRPPSTAPTTVKHQTSPPTAATKTPAKTMTNSPASQSGQHATVPSGAEAGSSPAPAPSKGKDNDPLTSTPQVELNQMLLEI